MAPPRSLVLSCVGFLVILLGLGAGVWWYLFGGNTIDSAELVPADTVAFASIPNGAAVLAGYQTSNLKVLVDSPNAKPLYDVLSNLLGQKTLELIHAFLPNLSGQSFVAITHFDYDRPEQVGLIAAMKPKGGLANFDALLEKLKTTWPDMLKQGTTGTGSVAGYDYQWIKGPSAADKICVAHIHGWIVTSWGEAPLLDWIQRYENKATTPSLAKDANYRQSLARVGKDSLTLAYVNCHSLADIRQKQIATMNPAAADFLAKKFDALGGGMIATRFENGDIIDRLSLKTPRETLLDAGMAEAPCPFETLKFAGGDTRFYWAGNMNWPQFFKNIQEVPDILVNDHSTVVPWGKTLFTLLQTWAQGAGLDLQHNVIDPLGSEFSVQVDWSQDTTYPEIGFFVKLAKPDDFKPTIKAIIDTEAKAYETSTLVKELNSNGQNFASLQFVQAEPYSPTITEDGPYLGIFLTANQAVRAFQRDESIGLQHRDEFSRQVGDKLKNATQLVFLDAPHLLNRAYGTAMPYVSLVGLFNKSLAAMLKNKDLPPDLTWLQPMDTWACVITPDDQGLQGYSVSGVGNQGIMLAGAMDGGATMLQSMGFFPKPKPAPVPESSSAPSATPSNVTTPSMNIPDGSTNSAPPTNSAPDATSPTNSAPGTSQ